MDAEFLKFPERTSRSISSFNVIYTERLDATVEQLERWRKTRSAAQSVLEIVWHKAISMRDRV